MCVFDFVGDKIFLKKVMNELDNFVCSIMPIIEKFFRYVIVRGYVSILFGRTRTTEDIDVIVDPRGVSLKKMRIFYTKSPSRPLRGDLYTDC